MIKVLQIVSFLNDGGAETLIKDYALLLSKEKFTIKIICIINKTDTANYSILKENNIEIISLFSKENICIKILRKIFGFIIIPIKLKKVIEQENPEVIHIHMNLLQYFSKISNILKGRKVFYTCHSLPSVYFKGKRKIEYYAAKKLIKNNNLRFITLHDEMKEEVDTLFSVSNSIVIKNGIDFKKYRNISEDKNSIRARLNLPKDAFIIGHVGRFAEVKNHVFLINLFENIIKVKPNSFLLLIGNGPLYNQTKEMIIQKKIQDKVLILSHRTDVPVLLKAMDVFVFPSKWEGFGIVIVEALLSGLRCIVSDKVPEAAYLSENVIPLSLEAPMNDWINTIIDNSIKGGYKGDLDSYDLNIEIKKLESLYLD